MIDPQTVAWIIGTVMGCWLSGFGIGKAVAWTRAIRSVA